MDQQDYITLQLINACLRENTAELITKGCIEIHTGQYWLCADHLARPLRLQVTPSDYLQHWLACFPYWQEKYQQWQTCVGFHAWLALLMNQDNEKHYSLYLEKLKAACYQRERCQQTYRQYCHTWQAPFKELNWGERVRYAERMASYQDTPYSLYNKEKCLLTDEQYLHYTAEGGHAFCLEWLAIPRQALTLSQPHFPSWWPHPSQLGLTEIQTTSHFLLPVHPITMAQLDVLPPGTIRATESYLSVYATQSITDLQIADFPEQHLQLPLRLSRHPQSAILIAPPQTLSTDQNVTEILKALIQQDPLLHGRLLQVDEHYYGYLNEMPELSFLLQRYPKKEAETVVSTAALGATMPEGHSYLHHILTQFGKSSIALWWEAYCRLMAEVHLTLWLRYGIVLDCAPQNIMLSFTAMDPLCLVIKKSGNLSILIKRFIASCPHLNYQQLMRPEAHLCVESDNVLAHKFITLILQRNLAATLESLVNKKELIRNWGYKILRDALKNALAVLTTQGINTQFAHQVLFDAKSQPIITGEFFQGYLACRLPQEMNYTHHGPNFLRTLPK